MSPAIKRWAGVVQNVFRASICEGQCALRRTLQSGRPIINQAVYIIDADSSRVPISISTAILRNADGEIFGGVETFRDLSQVEELRKQLDASYTFADIVGRSAVMPSSSRSCPRSLRAMRRC